MHHRRQTDFLNYCLAPLLASAFILATYVFHAYLFSVSENGKLTEILWLGGVSAFLGWFAFAIALGVRTRFIWDLGAMLLSALLGVALFYYLVIVCSWIHPYMTQSPELYLILAPPLVLVVFLLAATIFVGLATFWTDDEDREYWARMGAWILIASSRLGRFRRYLAVRSGVVYLADAVEQGGDLRRQPVGERRHRIFRIQRHDSGEPQWRER